MSPLLVTGNAHGLGVETLRMLTQMVLSSEEELKLKYFKDDSLTRLCPVEAFVKAMLDVPFAFKRVDAMLYIASFYLEVNQLRLSYATLEVIYVFLGKRFAFSMYTACVNYVVWVGIPHECLGLYCAQMILPL